MHLTSPPNTIGAEIYLAAAATIERQPACSGDQDTLICCTKFGQPYRNSDPHIGFLANNLAVGKGGNPPAMLTLADPVGLYMQTPDFSGYNFPPGTTHEDWYTVVRGEVAGSPGGGHDSILHATFQPPEGSELSISDVEIFDQDSGSFLFIKYAGQIAETFHVALRAVPETPTTTQQARDCVTLKSESEVQPWPVQFLPKVIMEAGSPTALAATVKAGQTYDDLALVVIGGKEGADISFTVPGLTATVTDFVSLSGAPGQTAAQSQAYILNLEVSSLSIGDVGVRVSNPGLDPTTVPFAAGLLTVVS